LDPRNLTTTVSVADDCGSGRKELSDQQTGLIPS
jgi:hypothetical protein